MPAEQCTTVGYMEAWRNNRTSSTNWNLELVTDRQRWCWGESDGRMKHVYIYKSRMGKLKTKKFSPDRVKGIAVYLYKLFRIVGDTMIRPRKVSHLCNVTHFRFDFFCCWVTFHFIFIKVALKQYIFKYQYCYLKPYFLGVIKNHLPPWPYKPLHKNISILNRIFLPHSFHNVEYWSLWTQNFLWTLHVC